MNAKRYVSVICEYNPFHRGHKYQLEKLKSEFDGVVCILSGDIVQRGSVAVASKYLRAEAALKSGANLVLELPVPFCCSSARDFAASGVHIAENIGTRFLAFGAEDDLCVIKEIDSLVSCPDFTEKITFLVEKKRNMSYPSALKALVADTLGESFAEAVSKPNNILALEYLAAIKGKNITPFVVKRDLSLKSSSEIRARRSGEKMCEELPEFSKNVFERELGGDFPRDIKKLDSFFIGTLRRLSVSDEKPKNIYSTPDGLTQKLLAESLKVSTVEQLVAACTDKVYTSARVRRAINALVFGITSERVHGLPPYTCVLAADSIGREILRTAKSQTRIDIITKPVKALESGEETRKAFLFSKGVEDIISLSAPTPVSALEGKTPFVAE